MAPYLVADYDAEDNFCAVIPYAGCTVDSLIHHPDWETTTTDKERLHVAKLMITQNLMCYDIMQKTVGTTTARHLLMGEQPLCSCSGEAVSLCEIT